MTAMARYVPAYNPTRSPVLVDGEGRQIAGGEWGVADTDAIEVVGAPVGSIERVVIPAGRPGEEDSYVDRERDEPVVGAVERGDLVLRPELLDREKVGGAALAAVEAAREANKPAKPAGTVKKAGETVPPAVEPQE